MLMVQNAEVLLLDEPTAGMTQAETHKTAEIINALKGKHTLLVVEHDMAFVREIAERITVMHLGQVLAEGNVAEIESNPKVREAYLGSEGDQLMLEAQSRSTASTAAATSCTVSRSRSPMARSPRARPQRHRQDDAAQDHHRPDRPHATASIELEGDDIAAAADVPAGPRSASPMCRRAARSSPTSRSARTS